MMRRKDENGFTLVELVISMGMFSIVMLAIMFFLTAGTKSYGHSKSELNLQMESQMLLNQIRDITYSSNYAKYDSTHKALILYDVVRSRHRHHLQEQLQHRWQQQHRHRRRRQR